MARTTLNIDEAILRQIKRRAADEGRSVQAVVNELLRRALSTPPTAGFTLELRGWKAVERPGVDLLDRDKLFDLMDGR
jgi:plasmid stability protein